MSEGYRTKAGEGRGDPGLTTVYKIRDAAGRHVADHVREDKPDGDKECRWRLPDGTWGLNGTKLSELPLYGSEQVSTWDSDDLVVLVEGEKARDALDHTDLFYALGTTCGASVAPGPEALEILRGRRVALWPDTDEAGRKHMDRVAEGLQGIAAEVLMYEWHDAPIVKRPDGKLKAQDAADHPTVQSRDRKALDRLLTDLESAPRWRPKKPPNPLLAGRVDMRRAVEDGIEPPEELEPGVLLKGKIHHLFAASESGKTMITLWLIKRRIEAGQRVVVFDAENGVRTIAERLERMGVRTEALDLLYYLPFPTLTQDAEGRRNFAELLDEVEPVLIVFDAWASFLSSAGLSENENADVEDWDTAFTKQAKKRGIASAILDHTPHDGLRSRGAARKREVADIQWRVKKTLEFNRDSIGEVVLIIEKDREGWMPGSATFSVGGKDGRIVCRPSDGTIEEPGREDGLTPSARKALDALRSDFAASGATATEWRKSVGNAMSEATFYRSRDTLIERLLVVKEGRRYYPTPSPTPGAHESAESRTDTPHTENSQELSSNSHESDESEVDNNSHCSHPPIGVSNESVPESNSPNDPIRALLANPPKWLSGILAKYRERPEALAGPTCHAIAAHLYDAGKLDTPDDWREVEPILKEATERARHAGVPEQRGA